jgi:multiple sugar transport system substrate-binding protein
MRKMRYLLILLLLVTGLMLVACGGAEEEEPAPADTTATEPEAAATEPAAVEPAATEPAEAMETVQIRWFVGLGTGTDANQIPVQEEVVSDFNASQDGIELVLEVVPYDSARDALSTQIASGAGPDIIGPVGWGGSNGFYGQWLDIGPYIESSGFDTSVFDPALVDSYQTEEGQVGLPFAVFPAAVYYVPAYFDEIGLAYPPSNYGDMYELDGEMVEWNWETFTEVARRLTIDINGLSSLDDGFDRTQMVQVGYAPQWQTNPFYMAAYRAGAAPVYSGESAGSYEATLPDDWKEANRWIYEGIWGDQPFAATGPLSDSPEFGNGNLFNSGKAAMAITPLWYTCCLTDFRDAGLEFQAGILPVGDDGETHGRVDADTFRIWKGTQHPEEAFAVLSYLITDGADKLLPIYGAFPAIAEKQEPWIAAKTADYPFVTPETWDVFKAGLSYPDAPSAEQFTPNWTEMWPRGDTFFNLMLNTAPDQFDFDAEWDKYVEDLTVILNK